MKYFIESLLNTFLINLFYFLRPNEKCVFRFDNDVFYFVKKLQQIENKILKNLLLNYGLTKLSKKGKRTVCLVHNEKQFFIFYLFLCIFKLLIFK